MTPARAPAPPPRVVSIDIFRALVIATMVFVNEAAGLRALPPWLEHADTFHDGMTFVDLVFPAFLFIVGMSIPLSLGPRLDRGLAAGQPPWQAYGAAIGAMVARWAGLIVLGVMMLNLGAYSAADGVLTKPAFRALFYLALVMGWNHGAPRAADGSEKPAARAVRWAGLVLMACLAAAYRGRHSDAPGDLTWLRTGWWGILGLIGWASLTAGCVFLVFRRCPAAMALAVPLLALLYLADDKGLFQKGVLAWLRPIDAVIDFGGQIGVHGAIAVAGTLAGMIVADRTLSHGRRLAAILGYGAAWTALAWMLHPYHIVSKNLGTPAWGLYSAAACCAIYAAVYAIADIAGWRTWAAPLRPAGSNALLAYILPSAVVAWLAVAGFDFYAIWPAAWSVYPAGLIRAALMSAGTLALTGLLGRLGVRLKS